ncbi:MAG: hypothetical protein ABI488_13015 [Polyangiaceae bacterium]
MTNRSRGLLVRARRVLFCAGAVGMAALACAWGSNGLSAQLIGTAHASGPAQTFELDINVAPGLRTRSAVLGAHGQFSLDDRAKVSAPVSNLGRGASQMGVEAHAQDVYSEPTLSLRDRAVISGAAIVGGLINKGNGDIISGGSQTGASFADPDGKTFFVSWPGDTPEAHDLQPGQSFTLVPGKVYGSISVKTNATLFLPAGTFTIGSLDIEPSAKLVLQDTGPISVFVKDSIVWRGVLSTTSGKPADWLFGYLGTQSVVLEAAFNGLFVGPNTSLAIGTLTKPVPPFSGQFFAKDIEVRPDAVIGYQPSGFMRTPLTSGTTPLVGPGSPGSAGAGGGGGTGGSGGTAGTADCTPVQMPLQLSNPTTGADGVPRYTRINSQSGTPACGPVNFCTGPQLGAPQVPLATINARLANPNTPKGTCPVEFTRAGDDCRIDPSTVDRTHSCNADTDCAGLQAGARCIDYCVDGGCMQRGRGCATTYDCVGAAPDALGCDTEELWNCTDPADIGSSVPGDVTSQLPTVGPSFAPDKVASLDPYADANGGACFVAHSYKSGAMGNGVAFKDPGGANLDSASTLAVQGASVRIPKSSPNWNLFANPLVSHSAGVSHLGLDMFSAKLAAEGSLVAGATVFGKAITALDVRQGATVTQCGVTSSPRFKLFGVEVASFQDVTTDSSFKDPCDKAYSTFSTALGLVDPILLEAHTLLNAYNLGHFVEVCGDIKQDFGLTTEPTFICPQSDSDAAAKPTAEALLNFVINRYQTLTSSLAAARIDALQKAANIASTVKSPADVGISSDFSELGLDKSIPIGPISVELAVSLYGTWSVTGGLTSALSMGNAQGQADPSVTASAHFTPEVSVSASLYVGVGISLGDIAGATVGLEGVLMLVDADAPVSASVGLQRTTQAETSVMPGHDYRTSSFNGPLIAGIPAGSAYAWKGTAKLGAAFGLASLSGHINAAARVHFLFFSKTFRKQVAQFTGFTKKYFPIVSIGGGVPPLPAAGPPQPFPDSLAQTGTPDFGNFGETFAYTQLALVGQRVVGSLPASASSTVQCPVVVR